MNSDAIYVRRGGKKNRRMEHVEIAERVLGHPLPKGAVVHHVDHNGKNNRNDNLVVCPSSAYHMLLHRRERALKACGDPRGGKCGLCGEWIRSDNPDYYQYETKGGGPRTRHRSCSRTYHQEYYRKHKREKAA